MKQTITYEYHNIYIPHRRKTTQRIYSEVSFRSFRKLMDLEKVLDFDNTDTRGGAHKKYTLLKIVKGSNVERFEGLFQIELQDNIIIITEK